MNPLADLLFKPESHGLRRLGTRIVHAGRFRGFQRQATGRPAFNAVDENTDIAGIFSHQHTCRSHRSISFVAVHETGLRRIDGVRFRIQFKQGKGDCARKMSLQPLSAAPDIDQLRRRIAMQERADTGAFVGRNAGQFDALLAQLLASRAAESNHEHQANPRQSDKSFLNRFFILGDKKDLLRGIDQDRRPTGEMSQQADLHGSTNMKRGELLRWTRIEYESPPPLLSGQLRCRQFSKFR